MLCLTTQEKGAKLFMTSYKIVVHKKVAKLSRVPLELFALTNLQTIVSEEKSTTRKYEIKKFLNKSVSTNKLKVKKKLIWSLCQFKI